VKLENIQSAISAASFTMNYPTGALRLASTRTGTLVPPNAAVAWNTTQPGRATLAVSSSSPWPASDGVLAEVTFEVLPGASAQYAWLLGLRGVEITPDGYAPRRILSTGSLFIGRPARPGSLARWFRNHEGGFEFTLSGDSQATYRVEASTDLVNWTVLTEAVVGSESLQVVDPDASQFSRRFYRARPVE
jgi:hypothetical protein